MRTRCVRYLCALFYFVFNFEETAVIVGIRVLARTLVLGKFRAPLDNAGRTARVAVRRLKYHHRYSNKVRNILIPRHVYYFLTSPFVLNRKHHFFAQSDHILHLDFAAIRWLYQTSNGHFRYFAIFHYKIC